MLQEFSWEKKNGIGQKPGPTWQRKEENQKRNKGIIKVYIFLSLVNLNDESYKYQQQQCARD